MMCHSRPLRRAEGEASECGNPDTTGIKKHENKQSFGKIIKIIEYSQFYSSVSFVEPGFPPSRE